MAKVALRFGCAKQSKNLKRYLMNTYFIITPSRITILFPMLVIMFVASNIEHIIEHRGASQDFATRPVTPEKCQNNAKIKQ